MFLLIFELQKLGSFMFFVCFVSVLIVIYSNYYMSGELKLQLYITLMIVFILRMLFLVVAGSFTILLLGWEGLGIRSFFLIMYYQT
jgi:NADH-ubiquinone oxidoreductase chain 5